MASSSSPNKPSSIAALLFLLLALLLLVDIARCEVQSGSSILPHGRLLSPFECGAKCGVRCSKASRAKLCLKNCNVCCRTCNCVPPGTAGNRGLCPCYAKLKNSKGTGKCP